MEKINLFKKYKTRSGKTVDMIMIDLVGSAGNQVTFPVKGSIFEKGKSPRYQIWTIDGRASVFGDHPDDLVEVVE